MKTCKGCDQTKPLGDFYANRGMADGHVNWCKPCMVIRHRAKVIERAAALRRFIQATKLERGCADCGYRDHPAALDFDHLPGFVKEHKLAKMAAGSTMAKIQAEIAKCDVVCANCHRVRTAERRA